MTQLFQTCKDTKFVSNSQRRRRCFLHIINCFRRAKIQNLSAIHNSVPFENVRLDIVSDVQRYKICQQFTTAACVSAAALSLFQTCKDTKFVSNSQQIWNLFCRDFNCFRRAKIQNLSAIHNSDWYNLNSYPIVSDVQRYKICQQFTTRSYAIVAASDCFRRAKIQNLSAIHNVIPQLPLIGCIVSDVQRYKICQQFTTLCIIAFNSLWLFQTCKDTKIFGVGAFIEKNPHSTLRTACKMGSMLKPRPTAPCIHRLGVSRPWR